MKSFGLILIGAVIGFMAAYFIGMYQSFKFAAQELEKQENKPA